MPNLNIASDRVNDFVVKFANVNGTGSASANSLIMKTIFRMGVPVTGKNYFPSNIQGLPTWYEIRVTREGYAARAARVDIMVAMNAETYQKDVREVASGGYLIYDSTWPRSTLLQRGDITVIGVPLARLVNENFDGVRNRILLKNIAYAGVLAALLDLDLEVIDGLMKESYGKKQKLLDSNTRALRLGYDHTKTHLSCPLPLHVEHLGREAERLLDQLGGCQLTTFEGCRHVANCLDELRLNLAHLLDRSKKLLLEVGHVVLVVGHGWSPLNNGG